MFLDKLAYTLECQLKNRKKDLENQINLLKTFCVNSGYTVNKVYSDIASGISFENRKDFFVLLNDILNKK